MTSYPADETDVVNRAGFEHDEPVARTQYPPTQGHRPVPPHVTAARKRQILIDAASGQAMYDNEAAALRKWQSSATAVNQALLASPSHAGHLGGQTYLEAPANVLPWILQGAC
jgi:hypothetical protein